MLHAKFQDHRTSGSGEEDFLRFLIGQAVSEEKIFKNGGRTTDDGRTPARWVYYKLTL